MMGSNENNKVSKVQEISTDTLAQNTRRHKNFLLLKSLEGECLATCSRGGLAHSLTRSPRAGPIWRGMPLLPGSVVEVETASQVRTEVPKWICVDIAQMKIEEEFARMKEIRKLRAPTFRQPSISALVKAGLERLLTHSILFSQRGLFGRGLTRASIAYD